MSNVKIVRGGIDRRRQPRGGRRTADIEGLSPLVMIVGDHAVVGDAALAILARLKFAVTPSATVDEALRVLATMRPDIIAANAEDAGRIRLECPEHDSVVVVSRAMLENPELLVDAVREALRGKAGSSA